MNGPLNLGGLVEPLPTDETKTLPKRTRQPPEDEKKELARALANVRRLPNSANAHFTLAEIYCNLILWTNNVDMVKAAIREYKRVIEIEPKYSQAYFGLGETFAYAAIVAMPNPFTLESFPFTYYEQAVAYYKQAISIDPDYVEAHVGLGSAYRALDRSDDAIAEFKLAIRISPNSIEAHRLLADLYFFSMPFLEAIEPLKTLLLVVEPGDASVLCQACYYDELVVCYTTSHRAGEGIKFFEQLISIRGEEQIGEGGATKSTYAHYALGMMYVRSDDTKGALEQYKILKAQGKGTPAELAEKLFSEIYK
ncbi:MAG: tetratricopeptide repeat protein [Pyrinomonadaceae bacterium]